MLYRCLTARTMIPLFLLVWGCLLLSGGSLAAEEFPISLDRPEKLPPGTRVAYRAIQSFRYFIPDQAIDYLPKHPTDYRTKYVIELRGQIHFKRFHDSSQRSIKVTHFHVNDELISEGFRLELKNQTLQIQEKNGKKKFKVHGTQIVGFDLEMLEVLFSVDWWGKAGTDKTFGTARAQAVGDTWTFQPSVASMKKLLPSEVYKEQGVNAEFHCFGKAKLVDRTEMGGRDCFQLTFSENCPDCLSGQTPDGLKILDCDLERTITGTLPLDPHFPWQKVNIKSRRTSTTQILEPPLNGMKQEYRIIEDVTREITFP
jgi:hypothetical protein